MRFHSFALIKLTLSLLLIGSFNGAQNLAYAMDEPATEAEIDLNEEASIIETYLQEFIDEVDLKNENAIIAPAEKIASSLHGSSLDNEKKNQLMETYLEKISQGIIEAHSDFSDKALVRKIQIIQKLIQDRIDNQQKLLSDLEADFKTDPESIDLVEQRIRAIQKLQLKLRAYVLREHKQEVFSLKKIKNRPALYSIKWGNLDIENRTPCSRDFSKSELQDAFSEGEIPEECQKNSVNYQGVLSVNNGAIEVVQTQRFESSDEITEERSNKIEWISKVAGDWDGLILKYTPDQKTNEPVVIDLEIGTLKIESTAKDIEDAYEIGNGNIIEIKNLLTYIPGTSNEKNQELIDQKIELQKELAELSEAMEIQLLQKLPTPLLAELDHQIELFSSYSFDKEGVESMKAIINKIMNDLDEDLDQNDLKKILDEVKAIKENTKLRKFKNKLLPFKDTDELDWFTPYVAGIKQRGIISGFKDSNGNELGEYRPSNKITVAEAVKISLEAAEKGQSEGIPKLEGTINHWSRRYIKKAEEIGLDVVKRSIDLNQHATRAEVVRMILEAFEIEPSSCEKTDFSDVPTSNRFACHIQYAKDLGIISGDANKTTFRPNDPINRAEVAKIATQAIEILLDEQID